MQSIVFVSMMVRSPLTGNRVALEKTLFYESISRGIKYFKLLAMVYCLVIEINYLIYVSVLGILSKFEPCTKSSSIFEEIAKVYTTRAAAHFSLGKILFYILYCIYWFFIQPVKLKATGGWKEDPERP